MVLRWNTKKINKFESHAESVLLCYTLPINKVEEGKLMTMENVARNEKLTLFLDYFVQQWMEYEKVPIKMLNIYKYRHRANSAVDG